MGTLAAALDVREVELKENLSANVEGDIGEVDAVLRITEIRLIYRMVVSGGSDEKIERALATYSEKCPAYQSVKESIPCSWTVDFVDP